MKTIWLDRTLLNIPAYLGFCKNEKAFKRELRRLKVKEDVPWIGEGGDASTHHFQKKDKNICIVCIKPKKESFDIWNLLTHEAVHVYQNIKPLFPAALINDELEAIIIQNINLKLWLAYTGRTKP